MRRPSPIAHRSTLTPLPPAWETPLARPRHNQHLPPPLQPRNNPATTAHHGSLLAATATEPAAAAAAMALVALSPLARWHTFIFLIVLHKSSKLQTSLLTRPAITITTITPVSL